MEQTKCSCVKHIARQELTPPTLLNMYKFQGFLPKCLNIAPAFLALYSVFLYFLLFIHQILGMMDMGVNIKYCNVYCIIFQCPSMLTNIIFL